MQVEDYLEEIYQELMEIQEDTNSINGEIHEYSQELIYDTSGEKYLTEIIERQNAQINGLYLVAMILATILIWNFTVRCWK